MPGLLRTCWIVILTTTAGGCAARSPAAAVPPGSTDQPADPPPAWSDSRIGPPFVVNNFEQAPRSNGDLLRTSVLHVAMDDLRRLRLIAGFQEVRLGLLRVAAGDQFERGTSVAYNFSRLFSAYGRSLDYAGDAVIEVWRDGQKIGECTRDGLLVGTAYSVPRK
jgi:hypothetical protein